MKKLSQGWGRPLELQRIIKKSSSVRRCLVIIFCFLRVVFFHLVLLFRVIFKFEGKNSAYNSGERKRVFRLIDMVSDPHVLTRCSFKKYTDTKVTFPLKNSFFVLTDIVGSTQLYNDDPRGMKHRVEIHDKIALQLAKKFCGHVVSNEGDSFGLLFEFVENAIDFSIAFQDEMSRGSIGLEVRIGINKGEMRVRNFYGYKCFGPVVDETVRMLKHNNGRKICLSRRFLNEDRGDMEKSKRLCFH